MMIAYRYDVFVSYSHRDGDWVRDRLLTKLDERGFMVCIDVKNFRAGAFSVDEMQAGVEDSRRVLLVLSPSYVDSEWGKFENAMAQTLDPAATQRKLVPALLRDCVVPTRLQILHRRDLREDDESQWELLFRDLM